MGIESLKQVNLLVQRNEMTVETVGAWRGRLTVDKHLASIQSVLEDATAAKQRTDELITAAKEVVKLNPAAASGLAGLVAVKSSAEQQVQQLTKIKGDAEKSIATLQVSNARITVKKLTEDIKQLLSQVSREIGIHDRIAITQIKELAEQIPFYQEQIDKIQGKAKASALLINDGQNYWIIGWDGPVKKEFDGLQEDIKAFEKIKDEIGKLLVPAKKMESSLYRQQDPAISAQAQAEMKSIIRPLSKLEN